MTALATGTIALPEPGVYTGVAESEYFAWPYASKSKLWALHDCPAKAKWERDNGGRESTDALTFGTAFDLAILSPDEFSERVIVGPTKTRDTVKWCEIQDENPDKILVTAAESASIRNMVASVKAHPIANLLLCETKGRNQVAVVWDDPAGVRCKARIDRWCSVQLPGEDRSYSTHIDVKTARSAKAWDFEKDAGALGYPVQEALYRRGCECLDRAKGNDNPGYRRFLFVVIGKSPDYGAVHRVSVFEYRQGDIEELTPLVERLLRTWRDCEASGVWPERPARVEELTVPPWHKV